MLDISLFNKPVDPFLVQYLSKHFQYKFLNKPSGQAKGKGAKGKPPGKPPGKWSNSNSFLVTHVDTQAEEQTSNFPVNSSSSSTANPADSQVFQ